MFGINVKYLCADTTLDAALEAVKDVGFDVLDYTPELRADDWESRMNTEFEKIQAHGLTVHQTHAPFNRYGSWGDSFALCLGRALDATIAMGAEYMVVHGDEFDFDHLTYTTEAVLEYNYKLFYPYVEKAAAHNVKIAFENVFEDMPNKPRFCSKAEDLKALIERYNTSSVCCCWDTGHAGVSFGDKQLEALRLLGAHVECTHIHDCGHGKDLHQPPFLGSINWDALMKTFTEIGYKGHLTYEMVYGKIPQSIVPHFAAYLKQCADALEAKK